MRKILRAIINKEEYRFPSTIEDASVLDNIKELFKPKKNMDTQKISPFMGWLIEKEVEEKCTFQEITELPAQGVTIEVAFSTVNYKDALALQSKRHHCSVQTCSSSQTTDSNNAFIFSFC